jgi:AMMECR1 domain-containing protein/orotate phosphoribosyltransferase
VERDRTELLELLRTDGILRRSDTQPVLCTDGSSARWMLDSLCVTLTPRGGELAARCLLRELRQFEGRQLATYGVTGVPLLEGCVLHGRGRYRGVLVRKERKPYGSLKLIEGLLDRSEPVVIVDDSVSSGYSMQACAQRLEEAGFHVEGGVCLVRFDYHRGTALMLERGYRMAAVFDIYEDFIRHMAGEAPYPLNPTREFGQLTPVDRRADEGLDPALLARSVIDEYLRTGRVLQAPTTLDRPYDAAGGCWVSLRRRSDVYDRPARDGFWRFPNEPDGSPPDHVVLAAVRTARALAREERQPLEVLADCAIAVTFFSALEECTVGQLDNDRYGIVVTSRERPPRMGGALPRMPGMAGEWPQFRHAARNNAQLLPFEPFRLYRHDVEKVVEPGARWQPTGVPLQSGHDGRKLTETVAAEKAATAASRRWVLDALNQRGEERPLRLPRLPRLPRLKVPTGVDAAFVTVYANGRIRGCIGGPLPDADALRELAVSAVQDRRFPPARPEDDVAVSLSLLANRHEMGVAEPSWAVKPVRFAEQALEVRQGDRRGILLPFVAVTANLTPLGYVEEVIDKAGITRPPYHWTRYDCTTWLADGRHVRRLRHGLPVGQAAGTPEAQRERLGRLLRAYARRHHVTDGLPWARYEPFADRVRASLVPARLAYGAWVKARCGLRKHALEDVRRLEQGLSEDGWVHLGGQPPSIAELAFLLLADIELRRSRRMQAAVAATLWERVNEHGRFATHLDGSAPVEHQDYAPGQALLALARATAADICPPPGDKLVRSLRYYRMRFRQNHSWGAVAWLTQAFVAWGAALGDRALTVFAYEIADWALAYQSDKTGAFVNDHQVDTPGATTAVYLEALASVLAATRAEGDAARERTYRQACAKALPFLDQLVYQRRDAAVLPNPAWAIGGLRTSVTASDVRLDHVHHALAAVTALRGAFREV